jgi:hypothetical protein
MADYLRVRDLEHLPESLILRHAAEGATAYGPPATSDLR